MNQLEKVHTNTRTHQKIHTKVHANTHEHQIYTENRANEHEHELDHGQQDRPKGNQTAGQRNQRQAKGTNDQRQHQGRERDQGQPTATEDTRTTGRFFKRFFTMLFNCGFFRIFLAGSSFFTLQYLEQSPKD